MAGTNESGNDAGGESSDQSPAEVVLPVSKTEYSAPRAPPASLKPVPPPEAASTIQVAADSGETTAVARADAAPTSKERAEVASLDTVPPRGRDGARALARVAVVGVVAVAAVVAAWALLRPASAPPVQAVSPASSRPLTAPGEASVRQDAPPATETSAPAQPSGTVEPHPLPESVSLEALATASATEDDTEEAPRARRSARTATGASETAAATAPRPSPKPAQTGGTSLPRPPPGGAIVRESPF